MKRKEPKECEAFHPGEKAARRKSGEWTFEDGNESRKKLDQQRQKLQTDLRDIEKLSCVSKRFRTASKVTCSCRCRRWRIGDMTSYTAAREEIRKVRGNRFRQIGKGGNGGRTSWTASRRRKKR